MSRDQLEEFEVDGLVVRIYPDDDPMSPREWSNLGTMVCWHRRSKLGDEQPKEDPSEWRKSLALDCLPNFDEDKLYAEIVTADYYSDDRKKQRKAFVEKLEEIIEKALDDNYLMLPLYVYEHGGITMRTSAFSCCWDSGQVGWIYVSHEKIKKEYAAEIEKEGFDSVLKHCEERLRAEVAVYAQYLEGDVYGYVIENAEGKHLDSCWGFYGMEDVRAEATSAAKSPAPKEKAQREKAEQHRKEAKRIVQTVNNNSTTFQLQVDDDARIEFTGEGASIAARIFFPKPKPSENADE